MAEFDENFDGIAESIFTANIVKISGIFDKNIAFKEIFGDRILVFFWMEWRTLGKNLTDWRNLKPPETPHKYFNNMANRPIVFPFSMANGDSISLPFN